MATLHWTERDAQPRKPFTPEQVKQAKEHIVVMRALIEQYLAEGDHKMVDICTDTLEALHAGVEAVEGADVDPDSRVC